MRLGYLWDQSLWKKIQLKPGDTLDCLTCLSAMLSTSLLHDALPTLILSKYLLLQGFWRQNTLEKKVEDRSWLSREPKVKEEMELFLIKNSLAKYWLSQEKHDLQ